MLKRMVEQVVRMQGWTVDVWHRRSMAPAVQVQDFLRWEAAYLAQTLGAIADPAPIGDARCLVSNHAWLEILCRQHSFNYLLWHEEDLARSPSASDSEIAQVKRAIDKYNQQRNDWIEKTDDWLSLHLELCNVTAQANAVMNTETPGSVFDRLSILSLRLYHLREEAQRRETSAEHRTKVAHKLHVCRIQKRELATALAYLLNEIFAGRKRHRTYRQCKMYNDPNLNPAIYQAPVSPRAA